ncbi:MAG: hypothetical protein PVJ04_03730 [Gemmatimonadota bacterium]|jgi:hypothetical protein
MSGIFRRFRGALGMALTWAVGWGLSVGALVSVSFLFLGNRTFFWDTVRPVTALAALSGFVGGAVFSLVLGAGYRRRMLGELRAGRMALWGAGAALLIPLALLGVGLIVHVPLRAEVISVLGLGLGALGAGTAGGIVWLAQKADGELGSGEAGRKLTGGSE